MPHTFQIMMKNLKRVTNKEINKKLIFKFTILLRELGCGYDRQSANTY